jgi:ribosomal small subunit protein bTHX
MGRGDKKSKKGKRAIGSFGNSRSRKKIKERLKRTASKKPTVIAMGEETKPKVRKVAKRKEE